MSNDDVLVQQEKGLLSITINRPDKHNPLSGALLRSLRTSLLGVAERPELKCVLVRGAGARYFAAGGDLRSLATVRSAEQTNAMVEECRSALDSVRDCPVPVIAVLNGDAIGGGAELAVACDMRLMRQGARIGFIQGRLNISSAWGGGPDLFALVGSARAVRMTTRGELVNASLALDWGLVDLTFADDEIDAAVRDFIAPILDQSPNVLRAWKAQAIAARRLMTYSQRREVEQQHLLRTWMHEDHWAAAERILSPVKEKQ